jgi:FixJ family two-component response regulator
MTALATPLIAIVDDDTAFLDLLADLLSDEGYETRVWKAAAQAYAEGRLAAREGLLDIGEALPA